MKKSDTLVKTVKRSIVNEQPIPPRKKAVSNSAFLRNINPITVKHANVR